MRMFQLAFSIFAQAVTQTIEPLKSYLGISVFAMSVLVLGLVMTWARRGTEGAKDEVNVLLSTVPPVVLVLLALLTWHMVRIPYQAYERQRVTAINAGTELKRVTAELERRRRVARLHDPAFQNIVTTINAFRHFGGALRQSNPKLIITTPEENSEIYLTFIQLAVMGSNVGNGNLHNLNVRPEHVEEASKKGLIPGAIVVHAKSEGDRWALKLIEDLGQVVNVHRSYDFPVEVDENTVWIQMGPGVKWKSDPDAAPQN